MDSSPSILDTEMLKGVNFISPPEHVPAPFGAAASVHSGPSCEKDISRRFWEDRFILDLFNRPGGHEVID
jgi:hypothetical protein